MEDKKEENKKNQYHCLDDICILVDIPSASTFMSRLSKLQEENEGTVIEYRDNIDDESDDEEEIAWKSSHDNKDLIKIPILDSSSHKQRSFAKTRYSTSIPELVCAEFTDPVTFAKEFVKEIIQKSEETIATKDVAPDSKHSEHLIKTTESSSDFDYVETNRSFTTWPTIEEFTIELGANKIDEYLSSFETDEDWLYVIYYHGTKELISSDIHKYQAIYSLPTWRYPIAQATASIYFTIEICKVKPKSCFVNVTFQYETFRKQYKPGIFDFQEKWLHYILDSKINLFKTITY
ncbi:hypothetical protein GWI33_008986 [Rhynchophorus ferrugineus]|uniref:A-kinase anchor protein 14 n=1 Tax=Rhynchophorus ferrugineus TaxID=354439 RepID=A0A834IHB8_RHYFE|nr:hypothetical protein GWI33_008986 [Rhynchophorus ferrugineus]